MQEIKSFNDWWEANHKEYEKIGINRIVAKTIWDAGVDCFAAHLQKLFP